MRGNQDQQDEVFSYILWKSAYRRTIHYARSGPWLTMASEVVP